MHLPIPDSVANDILDAPGVVSVGEGADADGNTIVVVGFDTGAAAARARQHGTVPTRYDGMEIRFVVRGSPVPLAALKPAPQARTERRRPVPMGVSVGHFAVTAGTSSWLLTNGSEVFMASNRHIYAPLASNPSSGDAIVQPGPHDGGVVGPDTIGTLAGYVQPRTGYTVDLAWIRPTDPAIHDNLIAESGPPTVPTVEPTVGMQLWKSGRTTMRTVGAVRETNVVFNDVKGARMERQFTTAAPSDGGDSGSPFYADVGGQFRPAGILWGALIDSDLNWLASIGCPASEIERESGMQIAFPQSDTGSGISRGALIAGGLGAAAFLASRR